MRALIVVANITISTVGVRGENLTLFARISDGTGGRVYLVEDLGTLEKLCVGDMKRAFGR